MSELEEVIAQAEAANERLMQGIEQAKETIIITDIDGTIQYVNPSFERITGYSRKDIIGKNPRILKSGMHDDLFYRKMWDTLISGETWSGEMVSQFGDTVKPHLKKIWGDSLKNFSAEKRKINNLTPFVNRGVL